MDHFGTFRCWHFWAFLFWNFFFFSTEIFVMSWSKINVFIFWIILGGSVQCASVLHCTGDALLDCCTVRLVGAAGWLPSRNCVWEGPFTNYSNIEGIMLFFFFFTCRAFLQWLWFFNFTGATRGFLQLGSHKSVHHQQCLHVSFFSCFLPDSSIDFFFWIRWHGSWFSLCKIWQFTIDVEFL